MNWFENNPLSGQEIGVRVNIKFFPNWTELELADKLGPVLLLVSLCY
jgi:hypothetical protein